jgi:hypothetical protein
MFMADTANNPDGDFKTSIAVLPQPAAPRRKRHRPMWYWFISLVVLVVPGYFMVSPHLRSQPAANVLTATIVRGDIEIASRLQEP